ncbi:hypothetical protein [Flavobacterium sp. C4GT6]|uniref:hypothetical protein n=1 Tax=Flavobacterium sp. C4GT6 TaxID=3103818 RepID=UPI002ED127E6
MKTFYNIIYLPLNANLREKISIGLIMSNGEETIFKVSYQKLAILKNLISSKKYSFIKTYFKNIEHDLNFEIKSDKYEIGLNSEFKKKWVNQSYMNYLHRYSNNLVNFSDTGNLDMDLNEGVFKKLFSKFIFDYDDEFDIVSSRESIYSKVEKKLYSKIEKRVNINVTVRPSDFEELLTPVDVNFIGKNGVIVAGQTVDFAKRHYNLENDLTRFISFTKAVDYSCKRKGEYFLIGQEPDKNVTTQNHKTWEYVKNSHLVKYVDFNEIDRISDYIENKDVVPLFDKEV